MALRWIFLRGDIFAFSLFFYAKLLVSIPSYVYFLDGYNQGVGEGDIAEIILYCYRKKYANSHVNGVLWCIITWLYKGMNRVTVSWAQPNKNKKERERLERRPATSSAATGSLACQDRSRSVLEIYKPLALARLYGESWIFRVNFVWYSLGIVCLAIYRRKYLLLISAIFSAIFCMRGNITL